MGRAGYVVYVGWRKKYSKYYGYGRVNSWQRFSRKR